MAPNGSDRAAGTIGAPLRTVAAAIAAAPSGATIVLRAGSYHENVVIPPGKRLTVQAYPHEAVWFDGSVPVAGFTKSGTAWVKSGWTAKFDASPTFTRGAADFTASGWTFINPAYPMAAHPDQVWIDGQPQAQVGSRSQVTPGTFYVDYATSRLYLGTDPAGRSVRASDLSQAIMVVSANSVVRGIGIRRYADAIPDFGAISARRPGVVFQNVVVEDSATIGLSIMSTDVVLDRVTVTRSGFLGIQANRADRLRVDRTLVSYSNTENFNQVPSAGGMKMTHTRGVTVNSSAFAHNNCTGLWFDESVYDITVANSTLSNNDRHGLVLELSAKAVAANNVIVDNGQNGIYVVDTSGVQIWNNTMGGNGVNALAVSQDSRRPISATTTGRDVRQPFPDPTMTWLVGPVVARNNIFAAGGRSGSEPLLSVRDFSGSWPISRMGLSLDHNLYNRPTGSPATEVLWQATRFSALAAFTRASGQGQHSAQRDTSPAVTSSGLLTPAMAASTGQVPVPLPAAVALAAGGTSGARVLGPWR